MTLTNKVEFYERIIPVCFPADKWSFDDVRSVASGDKNSLRKIAIKVWENNPTKYNFSAILLADINEIEKDGVRIYYGSSIGCSPIL